MLRNYINIINEAQAEANPYTTPEDRAKFAAMSPEDKEWYTRGGQVPDINDQYIAMRAPNKGRPVAQPAPVAEPAAPEPATAAPVAPPAAAEPVELPPLEEPPKQVGQGGMAMTGMTQAPKPADPLTIHIQQTLKRLGADLGKSGPNKDGVDGVKGPKTIAMMKQYGIGADGKPIANPAAPATGTQSNAVVNAAAAGAKPQDVETGGGAFMGNPNVQGSQARMSPSLVTKPIDPATGKPTDWPKMSLAQRAQWNNLQRANAIPAPTAPTTPTTPAPTAPTAPASRVAPMPAMTTTGNNQASQDWFNKYGKTHNPDGSPKTAAPTAVKETSGYDEVQRLVSLVHYR